MALERLRTEVGSTEETRATFRQIDRILGFLDGRVVLLRTALHAPSHITDAGDEIDGDQLAIRFTPVNYAPALTPNEVDDLDNLSAHLYGIDQALFTVASIDHKLLLNIGTKTHAQIDTHIANIVDPHGSVMEVSIALTTQLVISTTGQLDFEIRNLFADATVRIKNITGGSFKANLDVEKNIIVGGTVDGRDVAVDGTKLDTLSNSYSPAVADDWEDPDPTTRVGALDRIAGGHAGVVLVSDTEPTNPATGQLWFNPSATGSAGSGVLNLKTVTADTTLTTSDTVILCDATAGPITVTLLTAISNSGRLFYVKKIDETTNTVTIDGNGSETIEDELTAVLTVQGEDLPIVADGANYRIL